MFGGIILSPGNWNEERYEWDGVSSNPPPGRPGSPCARPGFLGFPWGQYLGLASAALDGRIQPRGGSGGLRRATLPRKMKFSGQAGGFLPVVDFFCMGESRPGGVRRVARAGVPLKEVLEARGLPPTRMRVLYPRRGAMVEGRILGGRWPSPGRCRSLETISGFEKAADVADNKEPSRTQPVTVEGQGSFTTARPKFPPEIPWRNWGHSAFPAA